MKRIFVALPAFEREWNRLDLGDELRRELERTLLSAPTSGVLIRETHGVRKLRFALPGRGKSGGLRVFYFDWSEIGHVFLMALIKKGEQENLTREERHALGKIIETVLSQYQNKTN